VGFAIFERIEAGYSPLRRAAAWRDESPDGDEKNQAFRGSSERVQPVVTRGLSTWRYELRGQ